MKYDFWAQNQKQTDILIKNNVKDENRVNENSDLMRFEIFWPVAFILPD